MIVEAYASQPHYVDHLAPIWWALPPAVRGRFVVGTAAARARARALGIVPAVGRPDHGRLVLVAGLADEVACRHCPVVLVEHGAGQLYDGRLGGAPPRPGRRPNLVHYLAPNRAAASAMARDAEVNATIVGSPRVEQLARHRHHRDGLRLGVSPVVLFAWHWQQDGVPEQGSAFDEWAPTVAEAAATLRARGWRTWGTGHPRRASTWREWYPKHGIHLVADTNDALAAADVVVADNTSFGWEAEALGIPVLWLDSAAYRRDVEHGMRFWNRALWRLGAGSIGDAEVLAETVAAGARLRPTAELSPPRDVYALVEGATAAAVRAVLDVASRPNPEEVPVAVDHDPFRGLPRSHQSPAPAGPEVSELRQDIVNWYDFHGLTPTAEQKAAWATMTGPQLVDARADLDLLSPEEVDALRAGSLVDVDVEVGEIPDRVADLVTWLAEPNDAPLARARANAALAHELARPEAQQRVTVVRAAREILDPAPEDPARPAPVSPPPGPVDPQVPRPDPQTVGDPT